MATHVDETPHRGLQQGLMMGPRPEVGARPGRPGSEMFADREIRVSSSPTAHCDPRRSGATARVTDREVRMTDLLMSGDHLTLTDRFFATRSLTESLSSALSAEDQTVQSMPDVSPTKWHRAHTTWFFETFLLEPRLPGYRVFHPAYGFLFNSYYEGVGARYPAPRSGPRVEAGHRGDRPLPLVRRRGHGPAARGCRLRPLGRSHRAGHPT